jgi:hypothetical protein
VPQKDGCVVRILNPSRTLDFARIRCHFRVGRPSLNSSRISVCDALCGISICPDARPSIRGGLYVTGSAYQDRRLSEASCTGNADATRAKFFMRTLPQIEGCPLATMRQPFVRVRAQSPYGPSACPISSGACPKLYDRDHADGCASAAVGTQACQVQLGKCPMVQGDRNLERVSGSRQTKQ